jgi:RHS repeat-associated protein
VIELDSRMQPTYYYHLKDHLGNVRAVVSPGANNTTVINQTNEYYPFGMAYTKSASSLLNPLVPNKYKYNGKEEQEMPGNWLDYGARYYDTQLGRWHSVDPMAEVAYDWSPYRYGFNNPMLNMDPTGMLEEVYITGPQAEKAKEELDKSSSLKISRDFETGKISATGEAKTDADKILLEAIQSESVVVNLETKSESTYDSKDGSKGWPLLPGGFEGSEVVDGKTVATQYLNFGATENVASIVGEATGETVAHEINESYIGGRDHPGGDYSSAYQQSHTKAASADRVKANIEFNKNTKSDPNNIIMQGRQKGTNTWTDIIKIPKK